MRLLIDLTSISGGGGLEQSAALIQSLAQTCHDISAVCVVRRGSPLSEVASTSGFAVEMVNSRLAARAWYYLNGMRRLARRYRTDVIYVPFGVGGIVPHRTPQIINVAYPILCYPDSPFWKFLSPLARWKTFAKCVLRRLAIRSNADLIVAENDLMAGRLVRHAAFSERAVRVVPPIVGNIATALAVCKTAAGTWSQPPSGGRPGRFLFITGAAQHKNVWRLGQIAEALAAEGVSAVLVLTVTAEDYVRCCQKAGVPHFLDRYRDTFEFLGATHGEKLIREIGLADAIANISDLESISNNFIEAAFSGKPMIVADRDFALDSVRTPFSVCEPHDPKSFVAAVEKLRSGTMRHPVKADAVAVKGSEKASLLVNLFKYAIAQSVRR